MMRAISLTQPWASLIAICAKKIETRNWATSVRGRIAIHAAKSLDKSVFQIEIFRQTLANVGITSPDQLPLGEIIATTDFVECLSTKIAEKKDRTGKIYKMPSPGTPEYAFGDFSDNRFMHFYEKTFKLPTPIKCRGALSYWNLPLDIEEQILEMEKGAGFR